MHSQDQRCNALQSVTGIFLHSCGAPEKLIKVLSRMGISVALSSIHRSIKSMSEHSEDNVKSVGKSLLTSYAFDNLDFKLPGGIPTIESPNDGLVHITTGTLLRLDHGVTLGDLRCSKELWDRSELNPLASDPRRFNPRATMRFLTTLHKEPDYPVGSLSRRGRFRAWFVAHTLLKHGPESLSHLSSQLPDPEFIDAIPVQKLRQQPLRAMDISVSSISGNLEAIKGLYMQGGVGDPREDPSALNESIIDISEYVTLIHGDLGTYEKVLSATRRRKQERTPYNRLQSVCFVLGLFHLKMASADAVWRILVMPDGALSCTNMDWYLDMEEGPAIHRPVMTQQLQRRTDHHSERAIPRSSVRSWCHSPRCQHPKRAYKGPTPYKTNPPNQPVAQGIFPPLPKGDQGAPNSPLSPTP